MGRDRIREPEPATFVASRLPHDRPRSRRPRERQGHGSRVHVLADHGCCVLTLRRSSKGRRLLTSSPVAYDFRLRSVRSMASIPTRAGRRVAYRLIVSGVTRKRPSASERGMDILAPKLAWIRPSCCLEEFHQDGAIPYHSRWVGYDFPATKHRDAQDDGDGRTIAGCAGKNRRRNARRSSAARKKTPSEIMGGSAVVLPR